MKPPLIISGIVFFSVLAGAQEVRLHGHSPHQFASQAKHPPTIWHPPLNTSWQWQLPTPVNQQVKARMYDIDMFDNDANVVASLHNKGRKVVCYISVGTWEDWRPDAKKFPKSVLGKDVNGWPGEKWLDNRRIDILGPIMKARMDQCRAKGFDGMEPDNVDGYANDTGFPLTYNDQISYNTITVSATSSCLSSRLAKRCLKSNTLCLRANFCPAANSLNFNSMKKHLTLDAYRVPCR